MEPTNRNENSEILRLASDISIGAFSPKKRKKFTDRDKHFHKPNRADKILQRLDQDYSVAQAR
jgi:hypothetical protein